MDVFQTPGDCDLTVNVDFAYLKEAMKDLGLFMPLSLLVLTGLNRSANPRMPHPSGIPHMYGHRSSS